MKLLKYIFSILFLLYISVGFAQDYAKESVKHELPFSIYSITDLDLDLNSPFHINKRLELTSYKFIILNEQNIEDGYSSIPLFKIHQPPTEYIYDSYNKINHNLDLKRAFFKVSDLYKVRPKNPY